MLGAQSQLSRANEQIDLKTSFLLRNIAEQPTSLEARFFPDGASTPGILLPVTSLPGGEIRRIDLSDLQSRGVLPLDPIGNHTGVVARLFHRHFGVSSQQLWQSGNMSGRKVLDDNE